MVNCKNCGAPLSLEDAVCPHCGTPNPEAQEHLKKLSQLNESFNKAKSEVSVEVRKSKSGYQVLVMLALVLLANLVLIGFHGASYEISERIIASRMNKEEIKETLETLLEKKEYSELCVFSDKYSLPYQEFGSYNEVRYLADYYKRLASYVTDYLYGEDLYYDPLVKSCESIREFKDEYRHAKRWNSYPEMLPYIEDLNTDFDLFCKEYLKLNDEDLSKAADLDDYQLLIIVNERLNNEKE